MLHATQSSGSTDNVVGTSLLNTALHLAVTVITENLTKVIDNNFDMLAQTTQARGEKLADYGNKQMKETLKLLHLRKLPTC